MCLYSFFFVISAVERLNPSCTQLYVDMYRYERNGVDATAASTTANYQFVRRVEQPSNFGQQQYAASFSFTPSSDTSGFYLGFRDSGTCVNILRLQVYYSILSVGKTIIKNKWGIYVPSSQHLCLAVLS